MRVPARSLLLAAALAAFAAPASASITPTITQYGTGLAANSAPDGITAGSDGFIYITEYGSAGSRVARVALDGTITDLPQLPTPNAGPQNLVMGPDGKLYVTEDQADKIAVVDPASPATQNEYAPPTAASNPHEITVGPDGRIWFGEAAGNRVAVLTTADPSTMHEYPSAGLGSVQPYGLVFGPDGALWVALRTGNAIARLDMANLEAPQFFASGLTASAGPRMIAVGSDGNLWFTEQSHSAIARLVPSTGAITEFPTPTPNSRPQGIAAGPDGALWFTENEGGVSQRGAIGRITTDGAITEYPLTVAPPSAVTGAWNIVQGPDGNMWFTEIVDTRVGRITTPPVASTGTASAIAKTSATLAGTLDGHAQATSFHFDYGTTAAYGASTPEQALGSVTGPRAVAASLSGLTQSTLYHYRIVATNPTGSLTGADATFTTASPLARPAVSGLRMGKRFRLGTKLPKLSKKVPTGTTIKFSLSQPAQVKLTFKRALPGRRSGRRCVAPKPRNKHARRCTRLVAAGSLTLSGHAGQNSVRFQGRLTRSKTLKPGSYVLVVTATNADALTSAARQARFTLLPRR